MTIKEVLVHIDDGEACKFRIEAAISLAEREKAHVTGIALALGSTISTYLGVDFPASLSETQRDLVQKAAENAVAKFSAMAKDAGVKHEGKILECNATKAPALLSFHARHSDICFVGQPNSEKDGSSFVESLLEGVLFGSGRPVYVVPYVGRPNPKIRKAVIAWDGGKKATRAVNDAIPLLTGRDGDVTVLVINPEKRSEAHGAKPGEDIAAHLRRHGIKVVVDCQTYESGVTPDNIILNYLADHGADLLVMGAYGHSRLREKAFGGVTSTILQHMTAPVLMSE